MHLPPHSNQCLGPHHPPAERPPAYVPLRRAGPRVRQFAARTAGPDALESELERAAREGKVDEVSDALGRGGVTADTRKAALLKAVKNNHANVVERLIASDVDFPACNEALKEALRSYRTRTWLITADVPDAKVVRQLMPCVEDIHMLDKPAVLQAAAVLGKLDIVQAILDQENPVQPHGALDRKMPDALLMAVTHGHAEVVKYLAPRMPNTEGWDFDTALERAIYDNNEKLVSILLASMGGNAQSTINASLAWAADVGNEKIMDSLLQWRKVNATRAVSAREAVSQAVTKAVLQNRVGILEKLLDDKFGLPVEVSKTMLTIAARNGRVEVFDLLVERFLGATKEQKRSWYWEARRARARKAQQASDAGPSGSS